MKKLPEIFENNRAWAAGMTRKQPEFFKRLAEQQNPKYLWIGCSDSRVPANEIMGLMPGEVFVHRNVANVVVHTDLNCLSVIQYAVDVLKVQHIIVCGHYGCGGVQAAWQGTKLGMIENWLLHVRDVKQLHLAELSGLHDARRQLDRLCELNVLEQARHVCRTTIVQDAWARGQALSIHGWVYGLRDGLLRDLGACFSSPGDIGGAE
ncbi:MAG: carbonate dehydratase [Gammaproteobacteria bacterium]|nr:carbonate dehydratase [Gammaproteobacteria bacterium]